MDLLPTVVSILDSVLDWQFLRGEGAADPLAIPMFNLTQNILYKSCSYMQLYSLLDAHGIPC